MNILLLAILLGILNGVTQIFSLSGLPLRNPLIIGIITGLIVGDVRLGFEVGSVALLMSIGFHTFGGASIPDYVTGSIFGVLAAQQTGDINVGLALTTLIGLLMTQMDILGRATTTIFQHGGDRALERADIKAFERWHMAGTIPWVLTRFIPVFIGVLFTDQLQVISDISERFAWFSDGLAVVGSALPAIGFALLLSYMDLKKYWPYMVLGYVFFAYLGMNTIGLAIVGAALAGIYLLTKENIERRVI